MAQPGKSMFSLYGTSVSLAIIVVLFSNDSPFHNNTSYNFRVQRCSDSPNMAACQWFWLNKQRTLNVKRTKAASSWNEHFIKWQRYTTSQNLARKSISRWVPWFARIFANVKVFTFIFEHQLHFNESNEEKRSNPFEWIWYVVHSVYANSAHRPQTLYVMKLIFIRFHWIYHIVARIKSSKFIAVIRVEATSSKSLLYSSHLARRQEHKGSCFVALIEMNFSLRRAQEIWPDIINDDKFACNPWFMVWKSRNKRCCSCDDADGVTKKQGFGIGLFE